MNPSILNAADAIDAHRDQIGSQKFTIGFDGFVDEIIHAVATRQSKDEWVRIQTISEFATRIASAAGKSANIELVPLVEKMGGNGPLMAMAVKGMGAHVTCIGLLGYPDILPVFKPLTEMGKAITVGIPGHTDAIEFKDGKLMLGKLNTIKDMNWNRLMEVIGEAPFKQLLQDSHLVACTNWTMLTEMEDVLNHIIHLVPQGKGPTFFFDLADPEKRDSQDVAKVLGQIQSLNAKVPCILGLNLREAEQVSQVLGLPDKLDETEVALEAASVRLRNKMGLHGIVVHGIKIAAGATSTESAGIPGPFCPNPKLSTGAGDHFNGGFTAGLMGGLSLIQALYCGVGTSGWYVRNAKSPQLNDVVGLLRTWGQGQSID